jgi:hypothetical protein
MNVATIPQRRKQYVVCKKDKAGSFDCAGRYFAPSTELNKESNGLKKDNLND